MAKDLVQPLEAATTIRTYAEFQGLVSAFAARAISLLIILGRPGLSKSQTIRAALRAEPVMYVKGRKTPIDYYTDLYFHRDLPVVLDDADDLLSQRLCKEITKMLTETDESKRLDWGSKTRILQEEQVPMFFNTKSPVCIISNTWNSADPLCRALESRGEFFRFEPDWGEVYRQVATWFPDQEILDYAWERLPYLREPDCRLFVKALNRKKAGLPQLPWRKLIDDHVDDETGLIVRRLMDDDTIASNNARAKLFAESTGADRATFYRRRRVIKAYRPAAVERIVLADRRGSAPEKRGDNGKVAGDGRADTRPND